MQVVTNRLSRYGIALLTTAGASLFALFLSPLSLRVPFALFAAAVIISALEGGLKSGLLATALSTVALGALYWVLPLTRLPENQGETVLLLVLFVIVGLMSSYLGRQCWRAVQAVEWVQATLASFGDGLIFTDTQGHVTFMNSAAHTLTGWKQAEIVQRLLQPECHGPDENGSHALERAVVRVLKGGGKATVTEPEERTTIPFSVNGAAQSVDAQAAPICDREGSLLGAVVVLRNATASQQRARDLQQKEEQFRALASCAPVGILQMDPECRCVYTNCSCQLTGGFSAEEGLGGGWTRFLHPEDHAAVVPAWTAAMQAGKEFACEFRFQSSDPSGRWVRLRSSPMYSDVGKVIGHVGILDDIAAYKSSQEALRESRTLLSALAEISEDALFVQDVQGRCVLTNNAGARMIGKTVKEIVGKDESELFAVETARHLLEDKGEPSSPPIPESELGNDRLQPGRAGSGRAQLCGQEQPSSDGQRTYITRKSPFRDSQGSLAGLITVCHDTTEEKRLATQLVKAHAALEVEVQARQHTEEELRQCQQRLKSCEARSAEMTKATSLLQDEALARQLTEQSLHEAHAQLQAGEAKLADLAKANAALEEAVQAADRGLEERSAELANLTASLRDEMAARRRAEEALEDHKLRLQTLTEKAAELENVKTSLEKEVITHGQAAEMLQPEKERATESASDQVSENDGQ